MYDQAAKSYGGENAMGLGNQVISGLGSLFGTQNPNDKTSGIMGVLSDILSAGGGSAGNAITTKLAQTDTSNIAALRERFTGTGVGMGTPAAVAESRYRSEAAPNATLAINKMQMDALGPLFNLLAQFGGKGVSQRQTDNIIQPSPILETIKALSGAATGAGNLATGFKLG